MRLDIDTSNFTYLKSTTWADLFDAWEEIEKTSIFVQNTWRRRGFDSWREWRDQYAKPLKLKELAWSLYTVDNPLESVPLFFGGPFKSWVQFVYKGMKNPNFKELIELPIIEDLKRINYLVEDFPKETLIIAVEVDGRITIVEGMHRCLAIALASRENREIKTTLRIAFAKHPDSGLPVVGQQVKNQLDEEKKN